MRTQTTLTLLVLALATGAGVQAQSAATTSSGVGQLGQRYAEVGAGIIDLNGEAENGATGDLSVNLPLQAGLDLGFGYSYGRLHADVSGTDIKAKDHSAFSTLTAFTTVEGVKPFVGAALGYQWTKVKANFGTSRYSDKEDEAVWGLGAGVEIPVGRVAITPTVTYQDGFKSTSAAGFTYGAEVSTWVTRTVGAFAEATYSDPTGGGQQSWTWKLGARVRF